ncbi:MAG: HNH endonuclease [Planctomycetaceae bacterium]|nr:HNH endonuclease [Planctomycetaceae bacterium]
MPRVFKKRERRPNSSARGYGAKWQRYSQRFLQLNPFCVACEAAGKVAASEATDHIKPVAGQDDPGFWVPANHQALCWSCHSRKTAKENQK